MEIRVLDARTAEGLQARAAGWLRAHGAVEGDRVAVVSESTLDVLVVGLAALRTGVVPVLLNPALTAAERSVLLDDARPRLVLGSTDLAAAVEAPGPPSVELGRFPRSRPMLYTSGTTGRPKGVWTGLLDESDAAALVADEADLWGFTPTDRHLVLSRLYHSAPFRFAAGTLLAGGEVAMAPDSHDPLGAVRAVRPTTTFAAPVHLQRLLAGARPDDLASFRLVAHAGSPCPTPLKERALGAFPGGAVWEFYGATEGQFTVCGPDEWRARPGTVGRARPGRTLAVDRDGTIWCRPPAFARFEYWRDPTKTAATWREDGSFTVGDLGRLDEAGFLYLDGRRDDLIITGGVNVYPLEVERVLLDHPGVADAAVFPVDDERWGQMVCAAVVPTPDDLGAREDELRDHVAARLAPYKHPKRWLLVDSLPHTPTGKLRRMELAGRLGLVETDADRVAGSGTGARADGS
ncbi:MAG TPA: class I adenylate-forming enzyme family protein [Acidimicrobiales bacterium]|nr:class I adenylate-forming enzyme family protein [Acidimicrobiales bacterium]